ncbi:MAG: glycosyltransferase family 61 protein [Paracoccaceae bacterium]
MTDDTRARFAALVHQALRDSAPQFRFTDVLAIGKAQGLLTGAEVNDMNVNLRAPVWLAEALAALSPLTTPDTIALPGRELIPAGLQRLTPSQTAPGTRLPKASGHIRVRHEPVVLHQGGPSSHNLTNFGKLSWTDQGILTPISDGNAGLFLPYLAEREPVPLDGHVFLGVVEGSAVYTHWLLDTFPRLLLLADAGVDLASIDTFLFATTGTRFHQATLAALGIPREKWRSRQHLGPFVRVTDRFIHVSAPRTAFACDPRIYDTVRSFFAGTTPPAKPYRRLFVTRRNAGRRKMLNEEAVIALLTPLGFEVVAFEDHSIPDTARMIAEATHLIAPHGAGLANLVFASPGLRVLELFNAHLSPEYGRICSQLGLEHHAMETLGPDGQMIDTGTLQQMEFFARNAMDLLVDVGALRDYLTSVFLRP